MQDKQARKAFEILRAQLDLEAQSFHTHYREIGDHVRPRRPRFYTSDVNKGDRRNQKIVDSTATLASRTLRSGMMGGITSPARQWFNLTIAEPEFNEIESVKNWLHIVTQRMNTVFSRSNLYNTLPIIYGDMGDFATAAMFIEEDINNVIRTFAIPVGSYRIANSENLKVEVFMREFRMTVRQIIQKFGRKQDGTVDWTNISSHVKSLFDTKQLETWIDVVHVILPNDYYDESKLASKHKKFRSCYYEKGATSSAIPSYFREDEMDKLLSDKGYDYFPVLAPRWEVTGEDVYGNSCPGMEALGDIKQLQLGERRLMQAIDMTVRPPMKGPTELQKMRTSSLPGDMTYVDERSDKGGYGPAFQIDPRIRELEEKQSQVRQRISRTYFEDLFLMLANSDRRDITAREIEERHEEKLLALGPVLEQLNQDLLDPLIDIVFMIMLRQGLIPPPPEEIQGMPLKVEYISIMAQAQKLAGISNIERFTQFATQVVATNEDAKHKVIWDELLDKHAEITSIPPGVLRSDEEAAAIRESIAQANQAQMQAEVMNQQSQATRNLASADLESNNALTELIKLAQAGQLTGVA